MMPRSPALQLAPRSPDVFRESLGANRRALTTLPAATSYAVRAHTLTIRSPAFEDGGIVPLEYSCFGDNVHPELTFRDPPAGTASYALVLRDIDAALEGNADTAHWVVWNIPAEAGGVPEGALPRGAVVGRNSAGRNAYLGPSAPPGTKHRHYAFELYALDCTFALPTATRCSELLAAIEANVLGTALYVGRFRRSAAALRRFSLDP